MAKETPLGLRRKLKRPDVRADSGLAQSVVEAIGDSIGMDSVSLLSNEVDVLSGVRHWVKTGFPVFDYMLSLGQGIPAGKALQFYGSEGVGKSCLAQFIMGCFQRAGGLVGYIDFETSLDVGHVKGYGVDLERVIYQRPPHIEKAGDCIKTFLDKVSEANLQAPSLLVWDSIAAAPAKAEVEEDSAEDHHVGVHARAVGKICRKLRYLLAAANTTMLFINQPREKIGVMFGDNTELPGGHGLRHASDTILRFTKIETLKSSSGANGFVCRIDTRKKNRFAPPGMECKIVISFTGAVRGPNPAKTALLSLKDLHIAKAAGRKLFVTGHGSMDPRDWTDTYLEDPDTYNSLIEANLKEGTDSED